MNKQGISTSVLHIHTLKPLDEETLQAFMQPVKVIISIEEHTIIGGLGSAVAEVLAEIGFDQPKKFARLAFPDMFLEEYGSQGSLLKRFGITTEKTVEKVMILLNNL